MAMIQYGTNSGNKEQNKIESPAIHPEMFELLNYEDDIAK